MNRKDIIEVAKEIRRQEYKIKVKQVKNYYFMEVSLTALIDEQYELKKLRDLYNR